ncbi:hypothetical protein WMY93_019089 [Mugilogobius chulae]|uniref:PDZ domain-containing protein n=1 Tax=Mugilogobius chulae TaxID=88201 RepID=A0AAW0NK70_9GOBI
MGPRNSECDSKLRAPAEGAVSRCRSCSDGARYRPRTSPKTMLKRPVSTEELQTPGGAYCKKTYTYKHLPHIVGDAVGWGFVVRGSRPCYIQAVEPSGPAAACWDQVCQFVVAVNGLNVLDLDFRTVSHLILTGPRTVVLDVMEENQD